MKSDELIKFLENKYEYDGQEMNVDKTDGTSEKVRIIAGSVSSSAGSPFYNLSKRSLPDGNEVKNKRLFIFCGESEEEKDKKSGKSLGNDAKKHIKKAIASSGYNKDDYIVSLELISSFERDKTLTFRSMDFDGLMKYAKDHYDVGIYRKRVDGTPVYNLVMIRVKENDLEVRKYMDAYLASSDIGTYRDVKYTIAQFSAPQNVNTSPVNDSDWPHNLLIFGAPGTGKSHSIDDKIKNLGWGQNMKRVTFYEDYSYEKFVGAYIPYMGPKKSEINGKFGNGTAENKVEIQYNQDKSIEYRFVPGIFLQMVVDAWFDSNSSERVNYVLVIEEINRANAASVFGDFFQLLDRDENGISKYTIALSDDMRQWIKGYVNSKAGDKAISGDDLSRLNGWVESWLDNFKLPGNLYIWATMNSADQGVYPMDAAFKRRWSYIYKTTQSVSNRGIIVKWKREDGGTNDYELPCDVLKTIINELMEKSGNIEEDRFVGPWYFNSTEINQISRFTLATGLERADGGLADPITNKLFQYLRQDVFRNNPDAIFCKEYLTMSKIRQAMVDGKGINEILNIDRLGKDFKVDGKSIADILKSEPDIVVNWKKEEERKSYKIPWTALQTAINKLMEKGENIESNKHLDTWYFLPSEITCIESFTNADKSTRENLPDLLSTKLFKHLLDDVFKDNIDAFFCEGYRDLEKISKGMIDGVGLNEILIIDDESEKLIIEKWS